MHRTGLRRALVVCLVSLGSAGFGLAQTKVAVVNLQRAVLETADIKKAQADLEAKYKPRTDQMEKVQKELQEIQSKLISMRGKLTPQAEQDLNAQGARKQRELQRLQEDLQADVDRERNEILNRSGQQMTAVVQKLAEDKGLDIVLDANEAHYFKPALDLTKEAVAAYDKAHPPK